MLPLVALVGRPNVGKSTLFNVLTRSRDALVHDEPGVTRDRHYGVCRRDEDHPFALVDTGGITDDADGLPGATTRQARAAVDEAHVVLFVVDGREGPSALDLEILAWLRKTGRRFFLVVNKVDGLDVQAVLAEFTRFGASEVLPVSSAHQRGIDELMETVVAELPEEFNEPLADDPDRVRIAFIGRPNVGKSTLVNRLLGEERMIVFDEPGTTRDAIELPFERGGRRYVLVDTAGVRRKGRVFEAVEKFSVVKTLQAIDRANVVVLVVDAAQGVSEQDAHLAGYVLERGRAIVVAANKWDGLDEYQRENARRTLERKLAFLGFARTYYVSALRGDGLGRVLESVDEAYRAATARLPTPKITRTLIDAVARQSPPRAGLVRPKLRYAHQGGVNPPVIVVHGTALDAVSPSYRRYLEGVFRKAFALTGTPLRIEFKTGRNPYVARKS